MAPNRSLQQVRTGVTRALSSDYFAERETSARLDDLLARMRRLDAGAEGAADTSRPDPALRPNERHINVRDGHGGLRLTDDAVRRELVRYLNVLGDYLPDWLCRAVKWLRKPERFFARLLVSLVLIVGAAFSFLPVLGLWMLPLGLIILSQDLELLQRPLVRSFQWIEHKWHKWRR